MNAPSSKRWPKCSFKLRDVLCPDPRQVLMQIVADVELSGEIVFLSDGGSQKDRFAIIEVEGIPSPLIVPVERLQPVAEAEPRQVEKSELGRRGHGYQGLSRSL